MPDCGPPQHQCLETAVPQAPVTVQAGGGGVTCSDLHRKASYCMLSRLGLVCHTRNTGHCCLGSYLPVWMRPQLGWPLKNYCGWGSSSPKNPGIDRQREQVGPGELLTERGVLFHSLLLEHLLKSWERIPKKVRCWEDVGGWTQSGFLGFAP